MKSNFWAWAWDCAFNLLKSYWKDTKDSSKMKEVTDAHAAYIGWALELEELDK